MSRMKGSYFMIVTSREDLLQISQNNLVIHTSSKNLSADQGEVNHKTSGMVVLCSCNSE